MRYLVIDASCFGAAYFEEEYSPNVTELIGEIESRRVDVILPWICGAEFLNICRKKIQGIGSPVKIDGGAVDGIVDDFFTLPIVWEDRDIVRDSREAWQLHRGEGIGTADAYYLQLAMVWGAELWTGDRDLASKGGGVHGDTYWIEEKAFAPSTP